MDFDSDAYDDVVSIYIRVVEQDSREAAAAIEQIRVICGPRAALRATLIVTISKMEFLEQHLLSQVGGNLYLMREFPEALALMDQALAYCVQTWNAAYPNTYAQMNGSLRNPDGETGSTQSVLAAL